MKKLKVASFLLVSFLMLTVTSCDNEPLEGDFSTETPNNPPVQNLPEDCESAQSATQIAEAEYNSDTSNSALCNAYVIALQDEITLCGDPNGTIQATIDGLGDCS